MAKTRRTYEVTVGPMEDVLVGKDKWHTIGDEWKAYPVRTYKVTVRNQRIELDHHIQAEAREIAKWKYAKELGWNFSSKDGEITISGLCAKINGIQFISEEDEKTKIGACMVLHFN